MHYFFVNRIEIKSETRKIEEKKAINGTAYTHKEDTSEILKIEANINLIPMSKVWLAKYNENYVFTS